MEIKEKKVGDWYKDKPMSDVSEQYILNYYLKPLYPNAKKIEGYVKSHDYDVPELNCLVELKTDLKSNKTTNLFIEYKCKDVHGVFVPSGIVTTKAKFWLISTGKFVFEFKTDLLREMYNDRWGDDNEDSIYRIMRCKSENESEGFIIPNYLSAHEEKIVHYIPTDSKGYVDYLNTLRE